MFTDTKYKKDEKLNKKAKNTKKKTIYVYYYIYYTWRILRNSRVVQQNDIGDVCL